MFKRIKSILKKKSTWVWIILLSILLYVLHIAKFPYLPLHLLQAGYVEGVVLDNADRPGCHWDNKLMGEGNSCDRHGSFEIIQNDGNHAGILIYQMDNTISWFIPAGGSIKACYGRMIGFSDDKVRPGDRIKMVGKKTTDWVDEQNGVRYIEDKKTETSYRYSHYSNCDSGFYYIKKMN